MRERERERERERVRDSVCDYCKCMVLPYASTNLVRRIIMSTLFLIIIINSVCLSLSLSFFLSVRAGEGCMLRVHVCVYVSERAHTWIRVSVRSRVLYGHYEPIIYLSVYLPSYLSTSFLEMFARVVWAL